MPTAENRFQIPNLHPKKHRIKKKIYFFWGCIFAKILPKSTNKKLYVDIATSFSVHH